MKTRGRRVTITTGLVALVVLLSAEWSIEEVEGALRSMVGKEALKVVVRP